jgi:hypothetical protein
MPRVFMSRGTACFGGRISAGAIAGAHEAGRFFAMNPMHWRFGDSPGVMAGGRRRQGMKADVVVETTFDHVTVAIVAILIGTLAFSIGAARQYLDGQLQSEARTPSALALSLSQPANQDRSRRSC